MSNFHTVFKLLVFKFEHSSYAQHQAKAFSSHIIAFHPETGRLLPRAANVSVCNLITVGENNSRPQVPGSTSYRFGFAVIFKA